MELSYVELRKKRNLKPVILPNKKKIYLDIEEIENTFSGRGDFIKLGNTFLYESTQLLINALELFELGYFDAAYYSLRSAIDTVTTMIFLFDMDEKTRSKYTKKWVGQAKNFPMRGEMATKLEKNGSIYSNMKEEMSDFFDEVKTVNKKLNKYVHKQGLQNFYVSRNGLLDMKSDDEYIKKFEGYAKKCIKIVAIMRLTIDPFPILLTDEEIYYRCFDVITLQYSGEFIEKYIDEKTLTEYKRTQVYQSYYSYFMTFERKNPAIIDIVHNQYINTKKIDEILAQIDLLSYYDCVAVMCVLYSKKIVKIYSPQVLHYYFTDRESNRTSTGMEFTVIESFNKSNNSINQPYDEAFISVFKVKNGPFYIEHNEILNPSEVQLIYEKVFHVVSNS